MSGRLRLSIIIDDQTDRAPDRVSTHPGEVLHQEFMVPLGLSANALARALHVPANRVSAIMSRTNPRAITPDTALRLSRYFGTTAEFWLNLQQAHDLSRAELESREQIALEVRPRDPSGQVAIAPQL